MIMFFIHYLHAVIDSFLMWFFRFPSSPVTGYFIGVLVLAIMSVLIGELSVAMAYRLNRVLISDTVHDMDHFQNLSIQALKVRDKAAFRACNSIANDAYGKSFFSMVTLSAASLWPVFLALGWLQFRFSEVTFPMPLMNFTAGYIATFIFCYILVRFVLNKIRHRFSLNTSFHQYTPGQKDLT